MGSMSEEKQKAEENMDEEGESTEPITD